MNAAIKKEFILDGLCCGNCAAKIEREIGKLDGVSAATVDLVSGTLTMEYSDKERTDALMEQACSIVKRHDPDVTLKEKIAEVPGKKLLYLNGLGCADCARKIEEAVRRLDGVRDASLDFVSQRLSIEADDRKKLPAIVRQAGQIAREIEPDIRVSFSPNEPEEADERRERLSRIFLCAGAILFAAGMLLRLPQPLALVLFLPAYLFAGGEVLWRALKNIARGQVFDENFLMAVASLGAFAIGEAPEGVAVMLFYQVGELFQNMAVSRSRRSIAALMDIRPDFANLKTGGELRRVSPEEVGVGDVIVVKPGEKVPLDGTVMEGFSSLDTTALTGESLPRDVGPGVEVLAGSINKSGLLTIEVTKEFAESTVTKILDLVQNAGSKKAPTENFITKFARYYTPFVVFAALALAVIPPLVVPGASLADWVHRALVFLVVSCPCALVISIPLGFFGGIGGASKNGILIKGSNYLEALNRVDTVVFDKTGTLTKGSFQVTGIEPAQDWTPEDLLLYAAHAEGYSNHPIAVSIRSAYGKDISPERVAEQEELPGRGVRVKMDDHTVLAGNLRLMEDENIPCRKTETPGSAVYLAVDGKFAGCLIISDEVKPDSKRAIEGLKSAGARHIAMLTGDNRETGEKIARELGISTVYTDLLPHQKVEKLELLDSQKAPRGKLAFVGDGINDAPVLARADIGIAMGALGSDAAIEAADVVLMTDEPSKLVTAIHVAKKTRRIVWQNIIFALGVKAVLLVLGAMGIATMWEAVFGDVGVAIIAILNAMRAMRTVR